MSQWNNRIVGYEEVPPTDLMPNPKNWRTHPAHQASALAGVLTEVGVVQNVLVNKRTGRLVDGHLRVALAIKQKQARIPVTYVDLSDEEEALILATIDPIAEQAGVDGKRLAETLKSVTTNDAGLAQLIKNLAASEKLYWDNVTGEVASLKSDGAKAKPQYHDPRLVDPIFTWSNPVDGCIGIAVYGGLLYGIRSGDRDPSPYYDAIFVDNKWEDYDHQQHVDYVARIKPKYATVLDLLTREQAESLNMEYVDFDTIMRYAEDVAQHAQNVIVIPKYDCINDIPKEYMLGYSVPSSYGGTPLPFEMFVDRRIHLLGGSPRSQWEFYKQAPESVVSVDTNYIHKVSNYGVVADYSHMGAEWGCDPESLKALAISKFLPGQVTNPLYIAFSINVGYYSKMWQRTAKYNAKPDEPLSSIDPSLVGYQ